MVLPRLDCKKLCQDSCGPVPMTHQEVAELQGASGMTFDIRPFFGDRVLITPEGSLDCPALKDGLCAGYDKRPVLCRLFGMVKKMRCPHGCEPSRWLTDVEAGEILDRESRSIDVSRSDTCRTPGWLVGVV